MTLTDGDYWQTGNTGSDYFRKSNDNGEIEVPSGHIIDRVVLRDFGGRDGSAWYRWYRWSRWSRW